MHSHTTPIINKGQINAAPSIVINKATRYKTIHIIIMAMPFFLLLKTFSVI